MPKEVLYSEDHTPVGAVVWQRDQDVLLRLGSPDPNGDTIGWIMSRSEINRLIRTLKRARNQVYGKDE